MNLPVQVMEPSCPSLIVQSDGHPVVPAALGNVILVEFANVAVFVSPRLWCQDICLRPTRIWDCSRYAERYGENEITSKSKREEAGQHRGIKLAVTTGGALQTSTRRNGKVKSRQRRRGRESAYLMSTI